MVDKLKKDEMGDPVGAGPPRGVEPLDLPAIVPELEHPVEFLVCHWWTTFDHALVAVARRHLLSACPTTAASRTAVQSAPSSVGRTALARLVADIGRRRWVATIIGTASVTAGCAAAWRIRVEEI